MMTMDYPATLVDDEDERDHAEEAWQRQAQADEQAAEVDELLGCGATFLVATVDGGSHAWLCQREQNHDGAHAATMRGQATTALGYGVANVWATLGWEA